MALSLVHYVVIAVVLVAILGLLYWRYRRAQQQNKSLEAELKVLQPYHKGPETAPVFKKIDVSKVMASKSAAGLSESGERGPAGPAVVAPAEPRHVPAGSVAAGSVAGHNMPIFDPIGLVGPMMNHPIVIESMVRSTAAAVPTPSKSSIEEIDEDDDIEEDDSEDGEPPLIAPVEPQAESIVATELPAATPVESVVTEKPTTTPADLVASISTESLAQPSIPPIPSFEPVVFVNITSMTPAAPEIDTGVAPNISEIVDDAQTQPAPELLETKPAGRKVVKRRPHQMQKE